MIGGIMHYFPAYKFEDVLDMGFTNAIMLLKTIPSFEKDEDEDEPGEKRKRVSIDDLEKLL